MCEEDKIVLLTKNELEVLRYSIEEYIISKKYLEDDIKILNDLDQKISQALCKDQSICQHCKIRLVEIDDMGYFGCQQCMPEISQYQKERILDQDVTGQDWESFG